MAFSASAIATPLSEVSDGANHPSTCSNDKLGEPDDAVFEFLRALMEGDTNVSLFSHIFITKKDSIKLWYQKKI